MLKSKDGPPPGPTYMSDEQKASYLSDLRSGRAGRPSGSRPPPPSKYLRPQRSNIEIEKIVDGRPAIHSSRTVPIISSQVLSSHRTDVVLRSASPFAGHPLVRPPSATPSVSPERSTTTPVPVPVLPYVERGSRWMEKQEAKSLRMALEDMDIEEDHAVHTNARDEAAELVWKHMHPDAARGHAEAPYVNPDLVKKDYHSHLRKDSYKWRQSIDRQPKGHSTDEQVLPSTDGTKHSQSIALNSEAIGMDAVRKVSPPSAAVSVQKRRTASGKSYGGLAEVVATDIAIAHRRTSGGNKRIMSGDKKMFMHPNDRIWEDPQEGTPPSIIPPVVFRAEEARPAASTIQSAHVRRNPFARVRLQHDALERSNSAPELPVAKHNRIEIQRNPPSQSRNPGYTSNEQLPLTPPLQDQPTDESSTQEAPAKEIRSDDIRAATSKQRKDRSVNLPQPTVVSDKPGRPIVSFQQRREIVLEEDHSASPPLGMEPIKTSHVRTIPSDPQPEPTKRSMPRISTGTEHCPSIPSINFPSSQASIPSIVLPGDSQFASPDLQSDFSTSPSHINPPSINISGPDPSPPSNAKTGPRPLPTPARPLPHHAATSPLPKSTPHYTPSIRQSGAQCAQCALPITGRILSAGGSRFHPACFVCHRCTTNLELVAFYPEPESKHSERVARLTNHHQSESSSPIADDDDNDPSPRFYCHLDFHELFSPRCKSCKTPIESQVIVACGAHWHPGHFFCAQCGDPFDAHTPFVEKDGYAWCVGCHTNRYSAKCRKCRKPVTEIVVKALGAEWHEACFVCGECNGDFTDGRYFLRDETQDPVCVQCEERRLKA